jgi:hypothetical protein
MNVGKVCTRGPVKLISTDDLLAEVADELINLVQLVTLQARRTRASAETADIENERLM